MAEAPGHWGLTLLSQGLAMIVSHKGLRPRQGKERQVSELSSTHTEQSSDHSASGSRIFPVYSAPFINL